MTIGEGAAIAAARAIAAREGHPPWREDTINVTRRTVSGRDVWSVRTDDAPAPGEPDWAIPYDGFTLYLIDIETGVCVGIGGAFGQRLFGPDGR
jgi:hypothetical protein